MNENTKKYIWYALGEIALVMIGILLALQINNWNEERKNSIEEARIIEQLSLEVQEAITSRKTVIADYQELSDELQDVIELVNNPTPETEVLSIEQCRSIIPSHVLVYRPTDVSTINELLASGNISFIKNPELRKNIVAYENTVQSSQSRLNGVFSFSTSLAERYPELIIRSWNNVDGYISKCNVSKMKTNQAFINQLISNQDRISAPIGIYSEQIIILNELHKMIQNLY